jgi:two-component system sensor histidine kinase BarA
MNRTRKAIGHFFSTIRNRVLLITFFPLFVAASGLTVTTIFLRQDDGEKNLQQFIDTTLDNLSSSADFGLYSGNINLLRRLTQAPLKNPYAAGIIFYDANGTLILRSGTAAEPPNFDENSTGSFKYNGLYYYAKPIALLEDDLMDQSNDDKATTKNIGRVVLAITREPLATLHQEILLNSLIAFMGIFTLALLLANRIGRSISQPVLQIAAAVDSMEAGNRDKRAPIIGTRETRALASTLNRLAESFEQTNIDLQSRITQATEKLQQALSDLEIRNIDLEEIRVDLESALSAKDAFLARMSHELRTPLTSVIGFNRLLDSSPLSAQQRQYSHNIEQSSALLLSTIEDILDFSKLESDAMAFESIDFNLREAVEDLISLQACNVYNKDVELVLLLEHDVPIQLQGDAARLKQVLNNLLSNALKFTECGEVILRISLDHLNDDRATVHFMVKDSGIGIARENLRHLFQPFQQADNTISRRFGGTGLGLTICQQLIEKMGGDISIYSTPEVGTEVSFSLELPLSEPLIPVEASTTVVDFPTLIIDTLPWSRRALRNQLSLWLNELYSMASHEQAINLLRQEPDKFRTIILSLRNTQLDEVSTSKLILALRQYYSGPILLLAGSVDFEHHEFQPIQHQFAPLFFLSKPARSQQLVDSLFSIHKLTSASHIQTNPSILSDHGLLHDLRILIVEDNDFNRELLRSIIHLHGGKPLIAKDGDIALEIFSQQAIDAVLIDMHMPVLNGIETTKIMRQRQSHSVVIIGLTADLHSGNIELLRAAGADEVLSKPINEDVLLSTLNRLLPSNHTSAHTTTGGLLAVNAANTKPALLAELQRLTNILQQQLLEHDVLVCRETTHQLLGLAGLFGMHSIEKTVRTISDYLNSSPLPEARTTLLNATGQLAEQLEQELSALSTI